MNTFAVLTEIAIANLAAWKQSGVVTSLKYYSAEDEAVCRECRMRNGSIVQIDDAEIGVNLPPTTDCLNAHCRCYFRPHDIVT